MDINLPSSPRHSAETMGITMGISVTVTRGTAPVYARAAPRMPVHSARTFIWREEEAT
jgi:hypothetical protein